MTFVDSDNQELLSEKSSSGVAALTLSTAPTMSSAAQSERLSWRTISLSESPSVRFNSQEVRYAYNAPAMTMLQIEPGRPNRAVAAMNVGRWTRAY